jgi:small ligand-binding sensory domain FIST
MNAVGAMKFQSLLSTDESSDAAVAQVIESAQRHGVGETDVAFVFLTPHHAADAQAIVEKIWLELDPQAVIGCTAEGVIGGQREIERSPGLAVLAGRLPGARIHPFHIGTDAWQELLSDPARLNEHLGVGAETRALIAMGDPWTSPMNPFMQVLDEHARGVPLIGGMASGANQPGGNVLLRNDDCHDEGLVGVSLSGRAIDVRTLVSQGCRPIGKPMVITKAREEVVEQLGGKPALQVLHETVTELSNADRELLRNGLFVGRAVSEYREKFARGDFVIRNVMRVDQQSGAIAVADHFRVGQTIQFHLRDAATAHEDLESLLNAHRSRHGEAPGAGALLFSCNGRGTNLFDLPCHDVTCAAAALPDTPVAGFFAAGELGPVGGRNFMHGHTASFAIFQGNATTDENG